MCERKKSKECSVSFQDQPSKAFLSMRQSMACNLFFFQRMNRSMLLLLKPSESKGAVSWLCSTMDQL